MAMKENVKNFIKIVSTAAVSVAIITQFMLPVTVYGSSMEPGFKHRDHLLVNRQAYNEFRLPDRGDVILFHSETIEKEIQEKILIKRIIGIPGDTIEVNNGNVYINGNVLKEAYIKDNYTTGHVEPVTLSEGEYFCMGDNRVRSRDSRSESVGLVNIKDILGRVFLRVYPFDRVKRIEKL